MTVVRVAPTLYTQSCLFTSQHWATTASLRQQRRLLHKPLGGWNSLPAPYQRLLLSRTNHSTTYTTVLYPCTTLGIAEQVEPHHEHKHRGAHCYQGTARRVPATAQPTKNGIVASNPAAIQVRTGHLNSHRACQALVQRANQARHVAKRPRIFVIVLGDGDQRWNNAILVVSRPTASASVRHGSGGQCPQSTKPPFECGTRHDPTGRLQTMCPSAHAGGGLCQLQRYQNDYFGRSRGYHTVQLHSNPPTNAGLCDFLWWREPGSSSPRVLHKSCHLPKQAQLGPLSPTPPLRFHLLHHGI